VATRRSAPEIALDELLQNGEDRIPRAFNEGLERLSEAVLQAARREERWPERIRAGLVALLGFLDEEPQWASLLILEAPLAGTAALQCNKRVQEALGEVLNQARAEVIVGSVLMPSPALLAELLVGAVHSVIRSRMLKGEGRALVELAPSLMSFIVEPYLGRGAVKADLAGKRAPVETALSRPDVVPIRPAPRTIQALLMIASEPYLSDREIATTVGISTAKGNHLKFFRRLEQRGVIENAAHAKPAGDPNAWLSDLDKGRGEPNAWLLTPYGRRVLELSAPGFTAAPPLAANDRTREAV
jgi:hypothetical protein